MEDNKIEKALNKLETEQSKAVKSKDVEEMGKIPIKKKKKKPTYRTVKLSKNSVTLTRQKISAGRKKPKSRGRKKPTSTGRKRKHK